MAEKIVDATALDAALTSTANAIRAKTGGSSSIAFDMANTTGFASAVADIPAGGGSAPENDVMFIDYDGTIVASYSAAEFANLTAMPANPTHTGLTAQGWNWTLADAKTYVASNGCLVIGQMYVTSDGKTRLYVTLVDGFLTVQLSVLIDGSISVDWGDNSPQTIVTGDTLNSNTTTTHTYTSAGDYVVAITVISGPMYIVGHQNVGSYLFTKDRSRTDTGINAGVLSSVKRVEVGNNVLISEAAFAYMTSLETITIPMNGIDSRNSYKVSMWYCCYGLRAVVIPSGTIYFSTMDLRSCSALNTVSFPSTITTISGTLSSATALKHITFPTATTTTIGSDTFQNMFSLQSVVMPPKYAVSQKMFYCCYSLKRVKFPSLNTNRTEIGGQAFYYCMALEKLTVPSTITSIGSNAFYLCRSMSELRFESTTPPTVSASSAFTYFSTDCVIYVPYSALAAYLTASNYPSTSTNAYLGFATYTNGAALPSQDGTAAYNVTWYATKEDAIAGTNAITVGNGNEIYCTYAAV